MTSGTLSGANLSGANLSSASVNSATLTGANLTSAIVMAADFGSTNLSISQLQSAASYQAHNLQGISLGNNDLSGWDLSGQNLTNATLSFGTLAGTNLSNANLTGAVFYYSRLTAANLAGANLSSAVFSSAELANANLSGATVAGAIFGSTNLSSTQLYSTGSYQAGNLHGINLQYNNLSGWTFSGQDLSNAVFSSATLNGANLTGANLTGAQFYYAMLTGANLSAALVAGADFGYTNLSGSQLYTTASYQARNLRGIGLSGNDLTGASFSGMNLASAAFSSGTLAGANLSGANLTGADLSYATLTGANLTDANLANTVLGGANLSSADLRGATGFSSSNAGTTANAILPDGTIAGLSLTAGNPPLVVRNYGGGIALHVQQMMALSPGGTLEIQLDGAPWGSTISFSPSISVTLDGNLELGTASGTNPSSLIGNYYRLFDWSGVSSSGTFQVINDLPAPYHWDLSQLYTSGNVMLLSGTAVASTWVHAGGGAWSVSGNWSATPPNGVDSSATFTTVAAAGPLNVALDENVTLGTLVLDYSGGYALSGSQSLTFQTSAGSPQIQVGSGSHSLAVDHVLLARPLSVSVGGGTLSIASPIGETAAGMGLTKSGPGTLVLSGSNNYTGTTTVSDGQLIVTKSYALHDGTDLTIGSATQLQLFAAPVVPASGLSSAGDVAVGNDAAIAPVPEPATPLLLALAGAILLLFRRPLGR